MLANNRKPKGKPPTKVWIGDEEYDSIMEGTHQILFNDMGIHAEHHPSVPVGYCEPDYVTDDWDYEAPLYIESKDDYYQGNIMHSIRFGREMNEYVYYLGAIQDPKDLYDVCDQAIGKAYRKGNHGFRQFWLYYRGMKDHCCIPMVSKSGKLELVPLHENYKGSHWALDECFSKYDIDVERTLGAYKHSASFTDWDATQGPDDDHPITREERKLMMTQTLNEATKKRTRKSINEQQSLFMEPLPIEARDDSGDCQKIIDGYLADIGFDPESIRGGDYIMRDYNAVDGDEKKFKTIFRCFYPLPKGDGYKIFHHLIADAITDCVCCHWDVIKKDPDWFVKRLHTEIINNRKKLLGELRHGNRPRDMVIAGKYNKYAAEHGAEKIDAPEERQEIATVPVEPVPIVSNEAWVDDLIEFIKDISQRHNESPDKTAQYIKSIIGCIPHLT